MELTGLSDDLFLELIMVHIAGWLNEHDRRRPSRAYDNAFCNEVSAHRTSVVFDCLGVASEAGLGLDPIVVPAARDVPSWRDLLEEIASMEVPVGMPQRRVWAVWGVREDHEFVERSGRLVDDVGVIGDGDELVRGTGKRLEERGVLGMASGDEHPSDLCATE